MEIRILGAHNCETASSRLVSILIDDVLALDAGGLTSSLPFPAQLRVKSVLISHHHFDHIRDLATLGLNTMALTTTDVYATVSVIDVISRYLFDGTLYPKMTERPSPQNPSLRLHEVTPGKQQTIAGYMVTAIPVCHNVPSVGYLVASPNGKSLFYSGDTGPGCSACWEAISPELLIMELTLPNQYQSTALESGHLTPQLLGQELARFRSIKGYLPPVTTVHMTPMLEDKISREVEQVANELGATITLGREGMRIEL